MFKACVTALCGLALAACATRPGNPSPETTAVGRTNEVTTVESGEKLPPLSARERRDLIMAGNEVASVGGRPEAIQRLKPLEVYYDGGNVVIALRRSIREEKGRPICYEERGYCVQSIASSTMIIPGSGGHWTFEPIGELGHLYEYVWKR